MKFKDAIGNFRFVDNWYSYSVNLDLAQILEALKQDCGGLTLTLEKKCHFPRRD